MEEYVPCPECGSTDVKKVSWTIWGGAFGPRMMNHVKCKTCGKTYNGKTGQSNTSRIIVYNVVIIVVAALIVYMALSVL